MNESKLRKNFYLSNSAIKQLEQQPNQSAYIQSLILQESKLQQQYNNVINLIESLSEDYRNKNDEKSKFTLTIYNRILTILKSFTIKQGGY